MNCQPEKVSAFVDGALEPRERDELAAHLGSCVHCLEQAEAERAVGAALRRLDRPEPPPGFEARLRARLARRTPSPPLRVTRVLLPLAAVLAVGLWARQSAPLVAWQLARDHDHCFSYVPPPASVRSADPAVVSSWFESRGTPLPLLPERIARLPLLGARYCRLADRTAIAHLYYTDGSSRLSLFVLPGAARGAADYRTASRGRAVALVRVEGQALGVVGETAQDVDSTLERLHAGPTVALAAADH